MKFCTKCGAKLEVGIKSCPSCGTAFGAGKVEIFQEQAVNYFHEPHKPIQAPTIPNNQTIAADEKYCFSCGSVIKKAVEICSKCGVNQSNRNNVMAVDVYCISCGKTIKKDADVCLLCGVSQVSNYFHAAGRLAADEKFCFSCGSPVKKAAVVCPKCRVNQNDRSCIVGDDVYCSSCGKPIKKTATECIFCGVSQCNISTKKWLPGLLLLLFTGGGHRIYAEKIGTGFFMILLWVLGYGFLLLSQFDLAIFTEIDIERTVSIFYFIGLLLTIFYLVWWIIDLFCICTGKFKDKHGFPFRRDN